MTLDFTLWQHRDYQSAYHFLKRLLKIFGQSRRLVTDQYHATTKAIKQLCHQGYLNQKSHPCSKYRNNLIEQDHRFIKRHRVRSGAYHSQQIAGKTLIGYEVVHDLYKKSRRELNLIGFSVVVELESLLAS